MVPRSLRNRLKFESLETRALLAGDSIPAAVAAVEPSASVILECLNRGEHTNLAFDRSGDGWVTPLDALLAIESEPAPPAQGEASYIGPALNMFGFSGTGTGPAVDAPTDPAEIDELFRREFFAQQVANPDGITPTSITTRYNVFQNAASFSTPLHWLGDDPDDSIYNAQIEFLNLPAGWKVTPKLQIDFPADVPKLARYDLRYRLVDRDGHASNVSVLRLTFIDVGNANDSGQNPVNPFDANDDGLVDYADLLTVERKLGPQPPPPIRLGGVVCGKYCESWRPPSPGWPLADVNGDHVVTEADVELLAQHLQEAGVVKQPPIAINTTWGTPIPNSNQFDGGWQAGKTENTMLSLFGRDPDGDERSFTVELLSESPFTIDHSASDLTPGSIRVHPQASAVGVYKVRFQLRDVQGLVSEPGEFTVYIRPPDPSTFQNPALASDVDNDGLTSPLDAMKLIMLLNAGAQVPAVDPAEPVLWDVDGDGQLSPLDALLVINQLNTQAVS